VAGKKKRVPRKPIYKKLDRYVSEGGKIQHKCVIITKHRDKLSGEIKSVWHGCDENGLPSPHSVVKFNTTYQAKQSWNKLKAIKKEERKENKKIKQKILETRME